MNYKHYKITIEGVKEGTRRVKEWKQLYDHNNIPKGHEGRYGYAYSDDEYTEEVRIFEQTVETLDIKAVIDAINKGPTRTTQGIAALVKRATLH